MKDVDELRLQSLSLPLLWSIEAEIMHLNRARAFVELQSRDLPESRRPSGTADGQWTGDFLALVFFLARFSGGRWRGVALLLDIAAEDCRTRVSQTRTGRAVLGPAMPQRVCS